MTRTAHDVRRLRVCKGCGDFDLKENMVGEAWHVGCYLDAGHPIERIPVDVLARCPWKVFGDRGKLDWALARISEAKTSGS